MLMPTVIVEPTGLEKQIANFQHLRSTTLNLTDSSRGFLYTAPSTVHLKMLATSHPLTPYLEQSRSCSLRATGFPSTLLQASVT